MKPRYETVVWWLFRSKLCAFKSIRYPVLWGNITAKGFANWDQKNKKPSSQRYQPSGWDLAEWLKRLAVNGKVATVLGSIPASSDTEESEGRQMKQCWRTHCIKEKIQSITLDFVALKTPYKRGLSVQESLYRPLPETPLSFLIWAGCMGPTRREIIL
jgi:hypothetical protein